MIKKAIALLLAAAIPLPSPGVASAQAVSFQAQVPAASPFPGLAPLNAPAGEIAPAVEAGALLPAVKTALPLGRVSAGPVARPMRQAREGRRSRTAALIAHPESVVPSAAALAKLSEGGASIAARESMDKVLGIRGIKAGQGAEPVVEEPAPAQGPRVRLSPAGAAVVNADRAPKPVGTLSKIAGYAWPLAAGHVIGRILFSSSDFFFGCAGGTLLFWALVLSLTYHEYGHAEAADKNGDRTPRNAGQLSLSPLRFTSPGGATLLLLTSLMGFPFGFFATNLQPSLMHKENKKAMASVAIAGPLNNLLIAGLILLPIASAEMFNPGLTFDLMNAFPAAMPLIAKIGVINFFLGLFNLIPLGPLDGQKILRAYLPDGKELKDKSLRKAGLSRFDLVSISAGAILLLAFLGYGLWGSLSRAMAGDLYARILTALSDPFTLAMLVNGLFLWAAAVRPALKSWIQGLSGRMSNRRILKAGGLSLLLSFQALTGKMPASTKMSLRVAVPWSGAEAVKEKLSGKSYSLAEPGPEVLEAVRLSDGESVKMGPEISAGLQAGRWLLLKGGEGGYALLPAEAVGGEARALEMSETNSLAAMNGDYRLLSPKEMAFADKVSEQLKLPVYAVDFKPDAAHPEPVRIARTANGLAAFLSYDFIKSEAERT
jgi:Zn-dependent protease